MSKTFGPPNIFASADRLISLQTAMHDLAAASAFIERALLLEQLSHNASAVADAYHACMLDPSDPRALALYCRLATPPQAHEMAKDLLVSPFASAAERRLAIAALDQTQVPMVLRRDLPLSVRLTLVQRPGDSIELDGAGPHDRVELLGNAGPQGLVALDCHITRPDSDARRLVLRSASAAQSIEIAAPTVPVQYPTPIRRPRARLWIVMPLKDGGAVLERCLQSVLDNLRRLRGGRLVLVDDGSTQPETQRLLADCARHPGVSVTRTPGSLGFTGAVNHGLRQIGAGPVLLLNSDIWLAQQTLPRLLAHLRDPEVGTVTPLSNNAGSVCLLGPGKPAQMPEPAICEHLAAAAFQNNRGIGVDLPSGNGFAMLISEHCLRTIGPLSGLYDSGYYEEVDFCLRATLRGWRHIAATDCFVGHAGSVTYGAEKRRLATANYRRLVQRFPEYPALYKRFATLDPLAKQRAQLLAATAADWTPEPQNDTPAHPDIGRHILPSPPQGPLVLPLRGAMPAEAQLKQFPRLRMVPENALRACGLSLEPGHNLVAEFDPAAQTLLVSIAKSDTPLVGFSYIGATSANFADFEVELLDILVNRPLKVAGDAVHI